MSPLLAIDVIVTGKRKERGEEKGWCIGYFYLSRIDRPKAVTSIPILLGNYRLSCQIREACRRGVSTLLVKLRGVDTLPYSPLGDNPPTPLIR